MSGDFIHKKISEGKFNMKTIWSTLLVFSMIIGLAACNLPSSSTTGATEGSSTPAPGQTTSIPTSSGACANPYFPSSAGASWTYANTSPMAPDSTTTRTITNISPSGFKVNDATTPDINEAVKWTCQAGNLAWLDNATITAGDVSLAVTSATTTGYLIPAVIPESGNWSEKLELIADSNPNGKYPHAIVQINDTQIDCTANGKESITVKAGIFEPLKVTCVYVIVTKTSIDLNPGAPVTNNLTITDWYVAGIGSVKTEKTGDIIETKELTAYSIP
jgi:hypothetical protein